LVNLRIACVYRRLIGLEEWISYHAEDPEGPILVDSGLDVVVVHLLHWQGLFLFWHGKTFRRQLALKLPEHDDKELINVTTKTCEVNMVINSEILVSAADKTKGKLGDTSSGGLGSPSIRGCRSHRGHSMAFDNSPSFTQSWLKEHKRRFCQSSLGVGMRDFAHPVSTVSAFAMPFCGKGHIGQPNK